MTLLCDVFYKPNMGVVDRTGSNFRISPVNLLVAVTACYFTLDFKRLHSRHTRVARFLAFGMTAGWLQWEVIKELYKKPSLRHPVCLGPQCGSNNTALSLRQQKKIIVSISRSLGYHWSFWLDELLSYINTLQACFQTCSAADMKIPICLHLFWTLVCCQCLDFCGIVCTNMKTFKVFVCFQVTWPCRYSIVAIRLIDTLMIMRWFIVRLDIFFLAISELRWTFAFFLTVHFLHPWDNRPCLTDIDVDCRSASEGRHWPKNQAINTLWCLTAAHVSTASPGS
jgi:hypothetical protein